MPELAEVEIVRRNLAAAWMAPASRVLLHDDAVLTRGAPELLHELLCGPVPRMDRRGKYLIARFEAERAIVFHFRMTGKIVRSPDPEPRFARLAWDSADGSEWLVFKDSRRLGHIEAFETNELDDYEPLRRMGPEPHGLTGAELSQRLSPRRRLKDALMDQSVIAGVGNIAISEVFWRLRIPPRAQVDDLDARRIAELAADLPRYFDELLAVEMSDEVLYVSESGAANPFRVYGREGEPCPRCEALVERIVVGGRSSYYCPDCQGS